MKRYFVMSKILAIILKTFANLELFQIVQVKKSFPYSVEFEINCKMV